jgi:hypothetical protein
MASGSLWGKLSDLADRANDIIGENIDNLLEESDGSYYSDENAYEEDAERPPEGEPGVRREPPPQRPEPGRPIVTVAAPGVLKSPSVVAAVNTTEKPNASDVEGKANKKKAEAGISLTEVVVAPPKAVQQLRIDAPAATRSPAAPHTPATPPRLKEALKVAEITATTAINAQMAMAERCASAEERVADLQAELHRLRKAEERHLGTQKELQRAHQRIEELNDGMSALERKMKAHELDTDKAKMRAEEYGRELRSTKLELDNAMEASTQDSGTAKVTINELQVRVSELEIVEQSVRVLEADYAGTKADLAMKDDDLKRATEELTNLRGVLEGFSSELSDTKNKCTEDVMATREKARKEKEKMQMEWEQMLNHWKTKGENADQKIKELESNLKVKTVALTESAAEEAKLLRALDRAAKKLTLGADEELVDRRLVNKLLTTYLDSSKQFDPEVLTLMANILGFSKEEKERIGAVRLNAANGGRPSSWWGGGGSNAGVPKKRIDPSKVASLDDLWKNFLMEDDDDD